MKKNLLLLCIAMMFLVAAQAQIHDTGGNVGIGTTTPQYKLHIAAPNNDGILIGNYNDGLGWDGTGTQPGYHIRFAGFRDVVPNVTGARISALRTNRCCAGLYTGMDLAFYTTALVGQTGDDNLAEAMRIKDNGDVGIGTNMPAAKLHVSSGGASASSVLVKIGGIGEAPNTMAGLLLGGAGVVNSRYKGGMVFTPDVTNYGKGALRFLVNSEMSDASATLADTRMCIASSGNVGIGTVTPSEILHIQGEKVGIRFNPDFQGTAYIYAYGENGYQPLTLQSSKFTVATNGNENLVVNAAGNVGIGTISPSERLSVNGNIRSKKVIVTQTGWPDYVFDSSYQLPSLDSVSTFIQTNKHLPDMPAAATVEKDGHDLGEVQKMLLKKVEELTLYMIEMKKENELMKKEIEQLKGKK